MLKCGSVVSDSIAFGTCISHAVNHPERLRGVLWFRPFVILAITLKKVGWSAEAWKLTIDIVRSARSVSVTYTIAGQDCDPRNRCAGGLGQSGSDVVEAHVLEDQTASHRR